MRLTPKLTQSSYRLFSNSCPASMSCDSIFINAKHIRIEDRLQLHIIRDASQFEIQQRSQETARTSDTIINRETSLLTIQMQIHSSAGDGKESEKAPLSYVDCSFWLLCFLKIRTIGKLILQFYINHFRFSFSNIYAQVTDEVINCSQRNALRFGTYILAKLICKFNSSKYYVANRQFRIPVTSKPSYLAFPANRVGLVRLRAQMERQLSAVTRRQKVFMHGAHKKFLPIPCLHWRATQTGLVIESRLSK